MRRAFLVFVFLLASGFSVDAQDRVNLSGLSEAISSFQFINQILRPCATGATPFAKVEANPGGVAGNVDVTTCTGGSFRVNGVIITPGGGGLADPGSNGVVVRTALNVTTARTITAGTGISIANGNGVAGNPTITATGPTGSGTLNTIPKWTPSGSVLGDSSLSDNGTLISSLLRNFQIGDAAGAATNYIDFSQIANGQQFNPFVTSGNGDNTANLNQRASNTEASIQLSGVSATTNAALLLDGVAGSASLSTPKTQVLLRDSVPDVSLISTSGATTGQVTVSPANAAIQTNTVGVTLDESANEVDVRANNTHIEGPTSSNFDVGDFNTTSNNFIAFFEELAGHSFYTGVSDDALTRFASFEVSAQNTSVFATIGLSSAAGLSGMQFDGINKTAQINVLSLAVLGQLQLAGTTASFPSFKANSANVDVRLADDSAYTGLRASTLTADTFQGTGSAVEIQTQTASNTDLAGVLTIGGGGTVTYTYANVSLASAPVCVVTQTSAPVLTPWVSSTTTVLTVHGDIGGVVNYVCVQRN